MKEKKINLYLINVVATMLILPLACIIAEAAVKTTHVTWSLIGKYFIFWAIGVRLLIAGLKQSLQPIAKVSDLFILVVVLLYLVFTAIL